MFYLFYFIHVIVVCSDFRLTNPNDCKDLCPNQKILHVYQLGLFHCFGI